ncbi:hypothetical protein [uncultured Desulfovibrio sp.]|uniref:hypothetical protein n=1 Tax=uncultured Desulfovibrio sp. TaxID=167968 RepID=UPI00260A9DAF|nr:hypothetical protein [uncultured Desulfovibrio sp.]
MKDEQVKVVGTVEDVARAAYVQGFCEGYDAARLVVEVLANEERRGGLYGAEGILKALDMSRDKAVEMMGTPKLVLERVSVTPGPDTTN